MNRLNFLLTNCVLVACCIFASCRSTTGNETVGGQEPKAKHVILIGIDGWGHIVFPRLRFLLLKS